jgi:4-hydroxybenzoate polyprenyltransferase
MKGIFSFLRLIRSLNLIFIALTQYLIQFTIIKPILAQSGKETTLNDFDFFLLVLSTVFIAAAGYIINDYFDVKIDAINKPDRIYIDRTIRRRTAMLVHQVLTGSAVIIAFYVAWRAGNLKLAFIHPIVAALLWFYSTGYKRQVLIGNIIVSFLTALSVLIVALYERNLFNPENADVNTAAYTIFVLIFFYFLFAFLISMARELVKDMEDVEGDLRYGCKTLPIVIGIQRTKIVVYGISIVIAGFLVYLQFKQGRGGDFISVLNLFTTLEVPLAIAMYLLHKADSQKQFSLVSSVIKIVMLMGILTMVYFYYLMRK